MLVQDKQAAQLILYKNNIVFKHYLTIGQTNYRLCLQLFIHLKMKLFITIFLLCLLVDGFAQYNKELIQTNVVLNDTRKHFDDYLKNDLIAKTSKEPIDSDNEYKYESACLAASQFMIKNDWVKAGFDTLFFHYDSLQYSTKRALLEAVYGLYPKEYRAAVNALLVKEKEPKLFAVQAAYLFQTDSSQQQIKRLLKQIKTSFLLLIHCRFCNRCKHIYKTSQKKNIWQRPHYYPCSGIKKTQESK